MGAREQAGGGSDRHRYQRRHLFAGWLALRLTLLQQRQELPGGRRVAPLDGGQDAGHLTHVGQFTPRKPTRLAWRAIEAERALQG
jgi:hypothetical protein